MLATAGSEATRVVFQEALNRLGLLWSPLPDKPEETLELTCRALWFAAAGDPRSIVRCDHCDLPDLDADGVVRLNRLIAFRGEGAPLAHLTGRQTFAGLEMLCGPGALIPRRETELLARTAIDILHNVAITHPPPLAIDMCTGSGNVALALAASDERATVVGADISEDALALANRNAEFLALAARVSFVVSDLFKAIDVPEFHRRASVLTCNPPYIASAKVPAMAAEIALYEPRLAFDGGAFGLSIITRLITDAPRFVEPGGSLCFEVGAGNARFVADRLARHSAYTAVRPVHDEHGALRVLVATVA